MDWRAGRLLRGDSQLRGAPSDATESMQLLRDYAIARLDWEWDFRTDGADAREETEKYSPFVERETGICVRQQVAMQEELLEKYGIYPSYFYIYRLFREHNFRRAHLYLFVDQHDVLTEFLNAKLRPDRLHDKWKFYLNSQKGGIPAAPVYAAFLEGEQTHWNLPEPRLPRRSLYLKPTYLGRGCGHELWRYVQFEDGWRHGDVVLKHDALLARACELSLEGCHILQPLLGNHPANEDLAPGKLMTFRIVTLRHPHREPQVLMAFARIPLGPSVMDHLKDGNLGVGIDPESGVLGLGIQYDFRSGLWKNHPESGVPLQGRKVHGWSELREGCLQAHRVYPEFAFLAFDGAITPEGPALLEVNVNRFDTNPQFVLDQPWGATPYLETMLAALVQCEASVKA